ncbi:MAG: aminotransferase class V-fold PLP-dependent enzyme [Bacteroidales bacterium]|nr:aminotransferase class V-fold PLP-dependent enzyme [Bacteroidales bacterium]
MDVKRGFASDNNSGVHPDILAEIGKVNKGHTVGYGDDRFTEEAEELFRIILGNDTEVFFVFNGTAANVLGLTGVTQSWNSIITANTAHIEQDECGAAEKYSGCKVLPVDTQDGKINSAMISKHLHGFDFEHHSQPGAVSITQVTEMGTVYTPKEIKEIADFVHSYDMLLHMDGARLANAAAFLDIPFRNFTTDAGVDLLSFGGTKNGMMYGEAICFLKPGLSGNFKYVRKQGMQLASKMRYISAQFIAYFRNDLWLMNARHANSMAVKLAEEISKIDSITITQQVESNGLFLILPENIAEEIRESYFFYPWNEEISEYRLMTSWDTTESDIKGFVRLLSSAMNR